MSIVKKSVIGCVFEKNKILLIKRRDVPVWVLPGGKVDKDESLKAAVIREIKEETGFDVIIKRPIGEYIPINKLSTLTYLFECSIISGEKTISCETKKVDFFSLKDLPKKIPPPFLEWIQYSFQKKPFIKKKITSVTYFALFKNFLIHPILVFRFLLARLGFPINS